MTTHDERSGGAHEHELTEDVREAATFAVSHEQAGLASSGGMDSVISVAAFMVANRLGGLGWAIAASTAWSLKAAYTRRRKGVGIGKYCGMKHQH